jgi:hypothetical protein
VVVVSLSLAGETMHVDFGCLFDKGLTLEVPEMVPLRLTQNIVAVTRLVLCSAVDAVGRFCLL